MGKYIVEITEKVEADMLKIKKAGAKSDIKRIDRILHELSRHTQKGIGNPEKLKYDLSGYWSRRINKKDRLVYEIIEEPENLVVVVSALGHY